MFPKYFRFSRIGFSHKGHVYQEYIVNVVNDMNIVNRALNIHAVAPAGATDSNLRVNIESYYDCMAAYELVWVLHLQAPTE
jgi:hypothetical protein